MCKYNRAVYVDCTDTITSCNNTGIQRNVNNIIQRSCLISDKYKVDIIPVISISGALYTYNYFCNNIYRKRLSNIFARLRNLLDKIYINKNENHSCEADVQARCASSGLHHKIIEFCRLIMPYFFIMAHRLDGSLLDYRSIRIKENDIIFFCDSFWNTDTQKSLLRYKNVCKIVLVYDVIPITTPKLCDDMFVYMFNKTFKKVIHLMDGIITISDSERKAVHQYVKTISGSNDIPIDYYYLGADFAPVRQGGFQVRDVVQQAMLSNNVFLMVGTIEPRKNHVFVLDAFEKLWSRGENVSLCIIGMVGWKCSNLLERINSHNLLGKSLFYFNDANDEELAYCYEKCRAVVFASIAEGFGLPLVEAMTYGRSVLSSDIPVFRELGGEYPVYFALDDVDALAQCLYVCIHGSFEKRQSKKWISWDDSVINLFDKVLSLADESKRRREVS